MRGPARILAVAFLFAVSASPTRDAAGAPPQYDAALACNNRLVHTLPTGATTYGLTMRRGTVLFATRQFVGPTQSSALVVLDVATNVTSALTPLTAGINDESPDFVNDDFIVYLRYYQTAATAEIRAHFRGWDAVWATPDDVDWAFDSAPTGGIFPFTYPHGSEGEVAYVFRPNTGPAHVRHCDFFIGSPNPCVAGFVADEPQTVYPYDARAVPSGVTLVNRSGSGPQTVWQDPGQPAQAWLPEAVFDTLGPLVMTGQISPGLNVGIAMNPAIPPIWVVPAQFTQSAEISPTTGTSGNLRVGWIELYAGGFVADLGAVIEVASTSMPVTRFSMSPDGDDLAYLTTPNASGNSRIAVDTCL